MERSSLLGSSSRKGAFMLIVRYASAWSRIPQLTSIEVVRIVGLSENERVDLRECFNSWLKENRRSRGFGNLPSPVWLTYKERPTWLDVQVPGVPLSMVMQGALICLATMKAKRPLA
jgi:hypothetical protein